MLKLENVRKTYGSLVAVDDLSFTVKDGEIFGLLGENGAGKTTTFRMIMGLLEPDKGKITLNGKKIDYKETDKIGFVTEERSLLTKLTVKEMIEYYGVLKGMDEKDIDKKLDYWLEKFEITEYKFKKIKELSKGNQQKIQFISAVINFIIMAFILFLLVKGMNKLIDFGKKKEEPAATLTRKCPYCYGDIDVKATKCMHCTSDVPPVEE